MKRTMLIGGPLLVAMLVLAVAFTGPVQGKITEGETRPLKTKTLMGAVVRVNCGAVGKGLKAEEVDWDALHANAELLNECGHVLMADGRCPDKTWADAAKTLQGCSAVLIAKIEAEDAEGAAGAFKAMTGACAACHKAHKPKN